MFRKPKTKNIRQRLKEDDEEEEKKLEEKVTPVLSNLNEVNSESTHTVKTKSLLSFDQDEGDDVTEFKLKKDSRRDKDKALLKKHKKLAKEYDERKESIKKEAVEQDDIIILKSTTIKKKELSKSTLDEKPRFKVPEKVAEETTEEISVQEEVRQKFSSTFDNIPDAKAVYEARKRRERMRKEGGDSGFIPIADPDRLKPSKGERSRLVREDDENDLSDEESDGKFYSKSLLIVDEERRRAEQEEFLRIEQGDSDIEEEANKSDDDELARWEREQIRKGVSYQKVIQLQNEYNMMSVQNRGYSYVGPSNGHGAYSAEPQPMDMDVEIIEEETKPSFAVNLPTSSAAVSMESILLKLKNRIIHRQEQLNTKEADLAKLITNLSENRVSISGMESGNPKLQEKFKMFQEMRIYTRDLLECLNEKISVINSIEDDVMKMWKSRNERLMKRRRKDVRDQYDRCSALNSGRSWKAPSEDYVMRESDREARRGRRRIQREKLSMSDQHNEGLSSDDEEPMSQMVSYREKIISIQESASNIFNDASEDYADVPNILNRFIDWISVDNESFESAYIDICIPKLLSPFVRLQLLDWDPLKKSLEESNIQRMQWYKQILITSSHLKSNHPSIVNLIPVIVEKIIVPFLTKIVAEQWDPLSLTQSSNLSSILKALIDEYPTISGKSLQVKALLDAIRKKAKASIDDDTFVPFYNKESIENASTGCGAFVDRQFWTAIKLMRSISCFRSILSDECLEELIMEGIVNRSVVLSLQFSNLSDLAVIPKCRAVISTIHSKWLPPINPTSYRSLVAILEQIGNEHRNHREFFRELRNFIELARQERPK